MQSLRDNGKFHQNIFRNFRIDYINSFSPEIIHFEFSGVALAFLNHIDKLKGGKVVSCRGTGENVNLLLNTERQENLKKLFEKVDAIHCVSSALKSTVLSYCRQTEKLFVNNPAIDTQLFQRKKSYREEPILTILSVGRFIFQKGYFIGLLAIKKLNEYNKNFKWVIAGSGPQCEEILFHVHQMNLHDYVILVGNKNREEIIELYNEASIFFLPSVTEGIANVVLEAMSMELPVVSTRCGGMEEAIIHGENGLLSNVYDHISLAERLAELLVNCQLRKRLGKTARKTVVEKFDLNEQINKFEKVYYQLIQGNP
ncbi:MAG TPA: glycosyltransferase family 4 protein [Chitinophagaceae bacterium]